MAARRKPTKSTSASKTPLRKPPAKKAAAPKRPAPKSVKPARPPVAVAPPRAAGERRYWLLKTEPEVFSIHDLLKAPGATTHWDGVRNYQARNYMRDQMQKGDGVIIYHSNADPPAIAGIATIAREGYPDHTQFDPAHHHYDPDAKEASPSWFMVDVKGVKAFTRTLELPELRTIPGLERMVLLQKGSRLSVQPVAPAEWDLILHLAGA